jgi:hypothetical protein
MKSKGKYIILIWSILILGIVYVPTVLAGSACLTVNENGVCKTVYDSKESVYLNTKAGFLPDNYYFFVVLAPGGQPNPNDQGGVPNDLNLSDDYDLYDNRTFVISAQGSLSYLGDHSRNGSYIQLSDYYDSPTDDVYIIAVCSLADGYPVNPQDCSYNAFRIKNK